MLHRLANVCALLASCAFVLVGVWKMMPLAWFGVAAVGVILVTVSGWVKVRTGFYAIVRRDPMQDQMWFPLIMLSAAIGCFIRASAGLLYGTIAAIGVGTRGFDDYAKEYWMSLGLMLALILAFVGHYYLHRHAPGEAEMIEKGAEEPWPDQVGLTDRVDV